MTDASPPPDGPPRRFLFDGADLSEVPSSRRRVSKPSKRKRNIGLRHSVSGDVERRPAPAFQLVAQPAEVVSERKRRRARSRWIPYTFVALLSGVAALAVAWFAAQANGPSDSATALGPSDTPSPGEVSAAPNATFAAPASDGVPAVSDPETEASPIVGSDGNGGPAELGGPPPAGPGVPEAEEQAVITVEVYGERGAKKKAGGGAASEGSL